MTWFLCVLSLIAAVSPQPGRIGDLAYDDKRWSVVASGGVYRVRARVSDGEEREALEVSIGPGPLSACSAATLMAETTELHDRKPGLIKRPGFDIHLLTAWTGCRNWTPPIMEACTAYNGKIYRFRTPFVGCRGGPGIGSTGVDFLEQLRVP